MVSIGPERARQFPMRLVPEHSVAKRGTEARGTEPETQSATDESLVARYVAGDRTALRTLVERYQPDLMRFLIRLTGDRQAAEDAFQETFLQLHTSAARFDTSRRLKPWLFTIAANKARDAMRKQRRQPKLGLSRPVAGDGSVEFVDLLEIETDHPGASLDAREQQELVDRAIGELSHPLREVLLLAYFQKLSYAQIADELGLPLGTVKSRLHAAVAQFAKQGSQQRGTERPAAGE